MDPTRFDLIAIAVGQRTTRRAVLGLLAALGLSGVRAEEAGAACGNPGTRCTKATAALCCSGTCRKKRCRCPQRLCCQCTKGAGTPVACSFVTSKRQCRERCATRDAESALVPSEPGLGTTVCQNNECRGVFCVAF